MENEKVDDIFFLISGKATFVLPRYNNLAYINITIGSHFGVVDIIGSMQSQKAHIGEWYN
jgi:hypothetical protein